jgi:glycosyltransferase involved in cell wall biosynthesis
MNKILVVGQTPPPYGGQAIMIQRMLEGVYPDAKLYHVRMGFSNQMNDIGRFQLAKIYHLCQLILKTYRLSLGLNIKILYYPPAGPDLVPVLRDIVFLIAVRWLFRIRIFHFHAAGLSEFYSSSAGLLRRLMEIAYFDPDVAIRASRQATEDGRVLRARREFIVPCGIEDHGSFAIAGAKPIVKHVQPMTILYVGVLREDKGVLILLEAIKLLRERGRTSCLRLVGHFGSAEFERAVKEYLEWHGLADVVNLCGVLSGDDKWQAFTQADLFCFPSYFVAESFGVCLIEALSFGLPVVATRWRGIPDVIDDGENGFLVPIRDAMAVADRLESLIVDPAMREVMGRAARAKYERDFTLAQYHDRMNVVFRSITHD